MGGICGLSPRGRGKQTPPETTAAVPRSIPAWAGETISAADAESKSGVYPRVGGGNSRLALVKSATSGLSPRGRGKQPAGAGQIRHLWSIPAWAGETLDTGPFRLVAEVYPRVGGGNRGKDRPPTGNGGLSPRGRGKRRPKRGRGLRRGSIPAWAGETVDAGQVAAFADGLSPRGRGKPRRVSCGGLGMGSIPAWAGETPPIGTAGSLEGVYPRVGGGNSTLIMPEAIGKGLSPRGRGKHSVHAFLGNKLGSIPAWAGETTLRRRRTTIRGVYPRVGGGNPPPTWPPPPAPGLSPRGRGKRRRRLPRTSQRSIPAWAGETFPSGR